MEHIDNTLLHTSLKGERMGSFLIAHTRDDGTYQSLEDHLRGVAVLSREFAGSFNAQGWGAAAGLLHDDGKANERFQRRILALSHGESSERVDHSTPGAKYALGKIVNPQGSGKILAYCVAGHHTGLPDGYSGDDESCLHKRIQRSDEGMGLLAHELPNLESYPFLNSKVDKKRVGFQASFFTRMLFSCLVDADYLDTESFVNPERTRNRENNVSLVDMDVILDKYLFELTKKAQKTDINKLRKRILDECLESAKLVPGLFSLTVPTGGGKTLSSLAFAIKHAVRYGLKRVIYVIPYTSIIEQTAAVFRGIFGEESVLEHHSNFLVDWDIDDEDAEERRRFACENWNAPIVVTTNVQFFESFFANRSSKVRRLHNVAKSVVILDEAQMLPVPFLRPTMEVIRELSNYYGTSIVLCTATQPALNENDEFRNGFSGVREMMSDSLFLEKAFKRVNASSIGDISDESLVDEIKKEECVLCIVNTRAHARKLIELLGDDSNNFHLSALMCPVHRKEVLTTIGKRLSNGEPCRVISTQLIEAGVDIDFPVVFRAVSGIDSIVQAAGRCNREGHLESGGRLFIFKPEAEKIPSQFKQNAQISELVLRGREGDVLNTNTVRAYFRELFWLKDSSGGLDKEKILEQLADGTARGDFPFKTIARQFKLIPDEQIAVAIPWNAEAQKLCNALRFSEYANSILRRLQPYSVSLRKREIEELSKNGFIEKLKDGYLILSDFGMSQTYSSKFGLQNKGTNCDGSCSWFV